MTFTYAGEYASDVLYRTQGAAGGVSVAVTTSADEPATLYTDATKDTPLASSTVTTDQYGNLTFFADPGTYTCSVGSATFTAVVPVNPLEPSGGSGTVTSVAVESANGLAGTVADSTSTPQITLSTTATGVLKGASGVIGAATAGTDYLTPSGSGAALTGITAAQVGADASGAAATAQGNAESFATSAVATETSRAVTAEGLLAPKASPALTGTPTAPTASALTDDTQVATTAYADSAVGVEKTRAEAAEALLAPLASPALTGSPTAPTQTSSDSSTKIATDAFVQTVAAAAQAAAEAASDPAGSATTAVAAETSRAEAAEALKAPLASPSLTGTPTAPTPTASDNSTKLATTAFVTTAVKTGAQAAPAGFTPSNPPSFVISASQVMMGLGATCTYTPSGSGLVVVSLTAYTNNSSNDGNLIGARYGSGSAPAGLLSATATNASPCVFTAAGSAFVNTTQVVLSGTVPTGFTAGTTYYVVSASGTSFSLSASSGGSAINSSSTGSGISVGSVSTGTRFGAIADTEVLGNGATPYAGCFAATALLTLNPATAYWFDVACSAGGGHTSTVQNVGVTLFELP